MTGRVLRRAAGANTLTGAVEVGPSAVLRDERGRTVLDVERITYAVGTAGEVDANLASCLPQHRDALLDVRHLLYPPTPKAPS